MGDVLAPVIANVGLLLLCGIILPFETVTQRVNNQRQWIWFDLRLAAMLSATAIAAIQVPFQVGPFNFDIRQACVFVAVMLGGPITGLAVALTAAASRAAIGGPSVFIGLIAIGFFYTYASLYWALLKATKRNTTRWRYWLFGPAILSILTVVSVMPLVALEVRSQVVAILVPVAIGLVCISAGAFRLLIERGMGVLESKLLLERQLKTAQELARKRDDFFTMISHELRTPLNGMFTAVQLMDEAITDPHLRKHSRIALDSGTEIRMLISRVLQFSDIETNRVTSFARPFSLEKLSKDIAQSFSGAAQMRGIDLMVTVIDPDISTDHDTLYEDFNLIRRAVCELVDNAIKFTARGSVYCTFELHLVQDKPELRVMVSDSGIGIASNHMSQIFDPFFQADKVTQGCGLGLSVAQGLADHLGGRLQVVSNLNQGTVAVFEFPVLLADVSYANLDASEDAQQATLVPKMTILVAEDNHINQMVISSVLESRGHVPVVVEDGAKAVAIATSGRIKFDMVLMDIQMPKMDGLEATRQLRRYFDPQTLPIVALTANAFLYQEVEYRNAGMQHVLAKPLKIRELEDTIRSFARCPQQPYTGRATQFDKDVAWLKDLFDMLEDISTPPDKVVAIFQQLDRSTSDMGLVRANEMVSKLFNSHSKEVMFAPSDISSIRHTAFEELDQR